MAGDSLLTDNGTIVGEGQKVHLFTKRNRPTIIAGYCGTAALWMEWERWFSRSMSGSPPPTVKGTSDITVLAVMRETAKSPLIVMSFEAEGCLHYISDSYAIGSGSDLALGAMEAGKSALDAVKIACKKSVYCGGQIHAVDIRAKKYLEVK